MVTFGGKQTEELRYQLKMRKKNKPIMELLIIGQVKPATPQVSFLLIYESLVYSHKSFLIAI